MVIDTSALDAILQREPERRRFMNYGDCFSYALAVVTGEPLLFKGDDFIHTDVAMVDSPSA